jgi:tyrosyl-tRNA synthetase
MFGNVMSISDSAVRNYADLITRWTPEQIAAHFTALEAGRLHPRDLKMQLAREIADILQGAPVAALAAEHFRTVFQQRELLPQIPDFKLQAPTSVIEILTYAGLVPTRSEVRRLAKRGGIKLDGAQVDDTARIIEPDVFPIQQVGRRKFVRLLPG